MNGQLSTANIPLLAIAAITIMILILITYLLP